MRPWHLLTIQKKEYSWVGKWSKQGLFATLDSFIRKFVYLLVVIRAINVLDQQAVYWIANIFIWGWLLLPVLALSEMLKQDVSTNHPEENYEIILPAYCVISLITLCGWISTIPGWYIFIAKVLNAGNNNTSVIANLVYQLMPAYAFFIISSLNSSIFIAKGKVS